MVLIVKVFGFRIRNSVVEDKFSSFSGLFDSVCDFSVEIVRHWNFADLRDGVCWDSPTLHGHDPIVDGEFALILGDELLKLLLLSRFC
jgi:hypothetical protein